MTLPDRHAWIFSLKTFAGAMLALWCASALNLERPYWAMATAYIVAQPLTGAMRSKGVYRLIGTVIGAAVVVAIMPFLVNAPELMTAALAAWTGVCLFVALLDRTPRSYVFMLAGLQRGHHRLSGHPNARHHLRRRARPGREPAGHPHEVDPGGQAVSIADLLRVLQEQVQQRVSTAKVNATVFRGSQADRDVAKLNLDRTKVRATVNGMVTNFTTRPGDYVVRLAQRIPVRISLEQVPVGTNLVSGRTATIEVLPR